MRTHNKLIAKHVREMRKKALKAEIKYYISKGIEVAKAVEMSLGASILHKSVKAAIKSEILFKKERAV